MTLEDVKTALRVRTNAFDGEIGLLMAACLEDLRRIGVRIEPDVIVDDPLVMRAVILYAKAHFGFNEHAGQYKEAYESLCRELCISGRAGNAME